MFTPKVPNRSPRGRLLLFWWLAPLSAIALIWVTYLAVESERAINDSRLFWAQKTQVERVIDRMDSALRVLFTRESTLAPSAFKSYVDNQNAEPKGARFASPLLAPTVLATGLGPSFQRLYFEVDADAKIQLPELPTGADLDLALLRGHTTVQRIESARKRSALLQRFASPKLLLGLLRMTAEDDAKVATGVSPIAPFHAFFVPVSTTINGIEMKHAELLLLRMVNPGTPEKIVQGIWYDWPALRLALSALAESEAGAGELDLSPSVQSLRGAGAPAPGRSSSDRNGGQLATVALDVHLGGRPTAVPFHWSATTTSLAGAWAVYLASLATLHTALHRSRDLAQRRARFASAVTHELRTPLTTFCMYTEMLKEGMVTDEAQRQEYIETLHRESGRLRHIVDNVLQSAGMEQGSASQKSRGQSRDLMAVLEDLDPLLRRRCEGSAVELIQDTHVDGPCKMQADPQSVERILLNLVDNACKYGRPSNGAQHSVRITVLAGVEHVEIFVADNGPGVSATFAPKLFEAYERGLAEASGDRASEQEGLGLGLSLSRELAQSLGGDLTLVSLRTRSVTNRKNETSESTGATFCLRLPLAKQA